MVVFNTDDNGRTFDSTVDKSVANEKAGGRCGKGNFKLHIVCDRGCTRGDAGKVRDRTKNDF